MGARIEPRLTAELAPVDESEARFAHLVEQIETELRIIREKEEQLAEQRRRDAERAAERARLAAEQQALRRLHEEAAEALRLEIEGAERAAREPDGDSVWDEPVLPDQPLASIAAYARFLHALARGGDTLVLLRRHEMTPERWVACAQAWSRLFAARPDLATRFSRFYAALNASR
jgi:hypothetical protein